MITKIVAEKIAVHRLQQKQPLLVGIQLEVKLRLFEKFFVAAMGGVLSNILFGPFLLICTSLEAFVLLHVLFGCHLERRYVIAAKKATLSHPPVSFDTCMPEKQGCSVISRKQNSQAAANFFASE